jgi:tetratricopeptide (TPR) repeat protein
MSIAPRQLGTAVLYALLIWPALVSGASWGRYFAVAQLLVLLGLVVWLAEAAAKRRLEWRRTAADLPLGLLVLLVLVQLAIGNGELAAWALAPPPSTAVDAQLLPARFLALGTVSPAYTAQALLLFLTYAGAYALVVNFVRERRDLERLVRLLVGVGGLLAFLALLDFLAGGPWVIAWREDPYTGRLAGAFANPDHFASWLGMLVCLGLGYLLARRRAHGRAPWPADLAGVRDRLEEASRRYLPFVGVLVTALALTFTLSRGGIAAALAGVGALLILQGALGWARWTLVLLGALGAATLGYGLWIGLDPLLQRVLGGRYIDRWLLVVTTWPMIAAFPLLGVGLGGYVDAYFRFVPGTLEPGRVLYPHAHNDLLQLVVETGLVGAALAAFAVIRVGRDLVGAHLLGRGVCPVGGGEDEGARRSDPFSLGIAAGALAAVAVLLAHSAVDFSARAPANGILAAACLGIATVALHTRFNVHGADLITEVRGARLRGGRRRLALAAGVLATVALAFLVVRTPVALTLVDGAEGARGLRRADLALRLEPGNRQALEARARIRLAAARKVWNSGVLGEGAAESGRPPRVLATWEERREAALPLLGAAIADLRAAAAWRPANPFLHERLAQAHWTAAPVDPAAQEEHLRAALAHYRRAALLAPADPTFHQALAAFAAAQGGPLVAIALRASRDAVALDPRLLPDLVRGLLPAAPSPEQWLASVPASAIDRLELAGVLERTGLTAEAGRAYRGAVELAAAGAGSEEEPLARWLRARFLLRIGDHRGSAAEIEAALARDPENPELHLARAQVLAAGGGPAALETYRAAVSKAEARAGRAPGAAPAFALGEPRAQALAARRLGRDAAGSPVRYRRALGEYLTERRAWAEALPVWDAVIAETPEDSAAHAARGIVLDGLGARERAVEAYRRALALDGRAVGVRVRLARGLWDTEQYHQAMREWRAVIAQEPGNVEARLALARAHLRLGDRVAAVREYERVLLLAPANAEAREGFARLGGIPPR